MKRGAILLAWHAWQRLDAVLPRGARFALATVVGELLYWLLPDKRAAALENMAHVLGPEAPADAVRLAAKRSFRNYAKYLSEFTHLPRWEATDLEGLMASVTGWEHVEDGLADGKGLICVSTHFGNWDVAGWYFGQRHPFAAVVEPLAPPELDALVQGWRRTKHIGVIPLAHAARGVLRALHAGGAVALIVDRPTHKHGEGVPVQFFGRWTRVPAGAAHFALRTGAPIVAAGAWRTSANTYVAFARPPLRSTPSGDRDRDVAAVMQRIMSEVEVAIREHPDQWYMFRRMWPPRAGAPRPTLSAREPAGRHAAELDRQRGQPASFPPLSAGTAGAP